MPSGNPAWLLLLQDRADGGSTPRPSELGLAPKLAERRRNKFFLKTNKWTIETIETIDTFLRTKRKLGKVLNTIYDDLLMWAFLLHKIHYLAHNAFAFIWTILFENIHRYAWMHLFCLLSLKKGFHNSRLYQPQHYMHSFAKLLGNIYYFCNGIIYRL
jgi:hypothetical protein